jgi:hypothetical protein
VTTLGEGAITVSTKKIRSQGAYVIKAAETRPPRNRATTMQPAGGTAARPNTADRRVARALQQQKQQ